MNRKILPSPLRVIGPAFITASVVLGPGSILTNSQVGADFRYEMVWALVLGAAFMVTFTALSMRVGLWGEATPCELVARGAGRWLAILIGVSVFLITACFQFGNNLGVQAAIVHYLPGNYWVVGVNALIICFLFGFRDLYRQVERLMLAMVVLMIVGFGANLWLAEPSVVDVLRGLWPSLPAEAGATIFPYRAEDGQIVDRLLPVVGMVGTTFSVAGAFYQAYLVRQKGWTSKHYGRAITDTAAGISVLALISLMIMVTSAAVLHGRQLQQVGEVAEQLAPLFGRTGEALFCLGLFAAAFSSFLVNAVIGGSVLADGLGLGGYMHQRWAKLFSLVVLLVGMVVAMVVLERGKPPVPMIVFAQALTVLANPLLAGAVLWLAYATAKRHSVRVPWYIHILGGAGFVAVLFLAARLAVRLWLSG